MCAHNLGGPSTVSGSSKIQFIKPLSTGARITVLFSSLPPRIITRKRPSAERTRGIVNVTKSCLVNSAVRPRKPELIIRENEPKELPPDVVRGNDNSNNNVRRV